MFTYRVKNHNTGNERIYVTLGRVRVTIIAVEKQYYILCVSVALFMQHAMRMRRIILSTAVRPSVPYLFTLSH